MIWKLIQEWHFGKWQGFEKTGNKKQQQKKTDSWCLPYVDAGLKSILIGSGKRTQSRLDKKVGTGKNNGFTNGNW